jgi:uncharacterized protein YkwD
MTRYWPAAILCAVLSLSAAQEKKQELKPAKVEQELIDLTNDLRKAARLTPAAPSPGPLAPNAKLMTAARAHAANMAAQDKLDHTLENKTFADRAMDTGYRYRLIGENIAWGPETPKEVLDDWMNSPFHQENILKEEFTEIGVGVAKNQKGEQYWVQLFGTPLRQ